MMGSESFLKTIQFRASEKSAAGKLRKSPSRTRNVRP